MEEAPSRLISPTQEKAEPVENRIEKLNRLFLCGKIVTRPSKSKDGLERPLSLRAWRAGLYKEFKSTIKENITERKKILEEAHLRDEILKQYLNQGEVAINLPGLGEQKARYVTINPPEILKEKDEGKHIFFIPGISNDIDCVGSVVQTAALLGRKITVIAFPESHKGTVTSEFAEAVKEDKAYSPHTEFFKKTIEKLSEGEESFELWGFSTGGPIVYEILNDLEFQQKTENAVLFAPASSVKQSLLNFGFGVVADWRAFGEFSKLPYWNFTSGSKVPETEEQVKIKKEITGDLLKKVRARLDSWKTAKVKEGGAIIIASGRRDKITKSYRLNYEFLKNPQIRVLDLQNIFHVTPLMKPAETLSLVFSFQKEKKANFWSSLAK